MNEVVKFGNVACFTLIYFNIHSGFNVMLCYFLGNIAHCSILILSLYEGTWYVST